MSARYAIQTALVFDSSQPEYLLIEYREYGEEGAGRCIGQFFKLEDAFKYAHERMNVPPQLTEIEGDKRTSR